MGSITKFPSLICQCYDLLKKGNEEYFGFSLSQFTEDKIIPDSAEYIFNACTIIFEYANLVSIKLRCNLYNQMIRHEKYKCHFKVSTKKVLFSYSK